MLPKALIEDAPTKPGVYFFKNCYGKILYIGKAKSLRKRLLSYTYDKAKHRRKVKQLVRSTVTVDYEICGSELEALLLESRLIKKHQPKYNTLLKKPRPRPFIKITLNEDFPRILVDYEIDDNDRAKYFGPFHSFKAAQEAIEIIHKLFPLRTCERSIRPNPRIRPCFEYHIGRCSAPCATKISQADYRAICDDVMRLVTGRHLEMLEDLARMRDEAAAELRFEQAALIQQKIELIGKVQLSAVHNNNLAALCPSTEAGAVEMFLIKNSKLYAQHRIYLSDPATLEDSVGPFIVEVFSSPASSVGSGLCPRPITQLDLDAMNIISRWIYARQRENRIVALPDPANLEDALAQMTREVVRAIRSMTYLMRKTMS